LATYKFLLLAPVLELDVRFAISAKYLEREMLDIRLHLRVAEFTTDETFGIENATN
jgi:hypothetical protein